MLLNSVYKLKNTIKDHKITSKMSPADKMKTKYAIDEAIQWLDCNQFSEIDDFEEKKHYLEDVWNPIVAKMYQWNR